MGRLRAWLADHPEFRGDLIGGAVLLAASWLIFVIAACL